MYGYHGDHNEHNEPLAAGLTCLWICIVSLLIKFIHQNICILSTYLIKINYKQNIWDLEKKVDGCWSFFFFFFCRS